MVCVTEELFDALRCVEIILSNQEVCVNVATTQPELTNCLRDEPETATLRSVAVSWTSRWTGRTLASLWPSRGVGSSALGSGRDKSALPSRVRASSMI